MFCVLRASGGVAFTTCSAATTVSKLRLRVLAFGCVKHANLACEPCSRHIEISLVLETIFLQSISRREAREDTFASAQHTIQGTGGYRHWSRVIRFHFSVAEFVGRAVSCNPTPHQPKQKRRTRCLRWYAAVMESMTEEEEERTATSAQSPGGTSADKSSRAWRGVRGLHISSKAGKTVQKEEETRATCEQDASFWSCQDTSCHSAGAIY
jgi:hypothetical protein